MAKMNNLRFYVILLCFEKQDSYFSTPRLNSSQAGPAQQINGPGSIFGTMLSEWSCPAFQLPCQVKTVGLVCPPPLLLFHSTGPHRHLQSFPPLPESVSANLRCLQFRPPPFPPQPASYTVLCTTEHQASHLTSAANTSTGHPDLREPFLPSSKSAGRSADPLLFRTAGIALACVWLMRLTTNH